MEYLASITIPIPSEVSKRIRMAKRMTGIDYDTLATPHITLYFSRFRRKAFDKFVRTIQAKPLPSFVVELSGPKAVRNPSHRKNFLYVEVKNRKDLLGLHAMLLEEGNKFREGLVRAKDEQKIRHGQYSAEEARNILRYGYSRIGRLFNPHITLGEAEYGKTTQVLRVLRHAMRFTSYSFTPRYIIAGFYRKSNTSSYEAILEVKIDLCKQLG